MLKFHNNTDRSLIQIKVLINDLSFLLGLFEKSEVTKLLICMAVIFCLMFTAPAKWGLNSGQKSANIVADALTRGFNLVDFSVNNGQQSLSVFFN